MRDSRSAGAIDRRLSQIGNAGVRLGFFVIVTLLLGTARTALDLQRSLAQIDGLTGVLNARAFGHRCDSFVRLAERRNVPMTIGYIDIDDFKRVNDTLDHHSGDQVLRDRLKGLAESHRWPIGFSIGVITFTRPPASTEGALCMADQCMYRVKRSGKNAIVFETRS